MKKRIPSLLLYLALIVLAVSLALTVYAHPGRTDSSGGHTDRSTGEYHYHHGYGEHDHTDADGDGDLDCPYDFKDKTDHSYNGGTVKETEKATPAPTSKPVENMDSSKNKTHSFWDVFEALANAILPALGCGMVITYFLFMVLSFFWDDASNWIVMIFWIITLTSFALFVYLFL